MQEEIRGLPFLGGGGVERVRARKIDEPEAALSPTRQLALLSMLDELRGSSQFIIATHSPILLSLPSAEILSFKSDGIIPAAYSDLDSIEVLRSFLRSPERYHKLLGVDTESADE